MENILSYLLEYGGCSIQYRIKREIMNANPASAELFTLQEKILSKPKVKKVISKRHPNGWIGNELHGRVGQGLDSSVSFLLDNGIVKDSDLMRGVVSALLNEKEDMPYRTTFRGGEALDAGGRGGNNAVKAGVLADLGEEDHLIVRNEIKISLDYLRDSLKYKTIDDFSLINKRGIRYYKSDAHFPGANHLNILSAAHSWRTNENIELVKASLSHCLNIMRSHSPGIMFNSGSHFVGPFNFSWGLGNFNINELDKDSYALVWWLRSLYKLSKIGIVREVKELRKAYDYLFELVNSQDILKKQNEASLKRFKEILSVESSWRKQESILCDVMFYGVMILHYAGYDVEEIYV